MEIIICDTKDQAGAYAASLIASVTEKKNRQGLETVWGVATGSSPESTYAHLTDKVKNGLDVSSVSAFALDEYVGLDPEHEQSYHSVVRTQVVEKIGLSADRVRVLDGMAQDVVAECADFEAAIRQAGGVDVQILGIGANGHIGFNEPGSSLQSRTRIKTLAPKTVEDNARFFDGDTSQVPVHCLTQGIGTIMEARKIVLVADGANKADAIAAMVEGSVSSFCPGSVLQFHPDVTVVVDEAAASGLKNHEYYRFAQANIPVFQRPNS
ncbi:glucosamine-6-phosphate deaminase [Rothia nasimurium]|uniref:glucosamine-6-phosphate deaminase n=1 Tax=Rothia nasimurium TaxID=85336 RepID=UPI002DD64340|nr:glucosamine-6-phosphate deaminase [Rothia nasimurium]